MVTIAGLPFDLTSFIIGAVIGYIIGHMVGKSSAMMMGGMMT